MLPILGMFLGPFAIYEALLASRVIRIRRGNKISLDNKMRDWSKEKGVDPLTVATRAHANYVEGVPLALLIAGVSELNGADQTVLMYSLILLLIGRIVHVELGLLRNKYAAGSGRAFGTIITQGFIVSWGITSVYLAYGLPFQKQSASTVYAR